MRWRRPLVGVGCLLLQKICEVVVRVGARYRGCGRRGRPGCLDWFWLCCRGAQLLGIGGFGLSGLFLEEHG